MDRPSPCPGVPPGSSLPPSHGVSAHLFKVLGRDSSKSDFPSSPRGSALSFFLSLRLFLGMNYRKSFFVMRPHPLLSVCKSEKV